jgi:hypothetical protein
MEYRYNSFTKTLTVSSSQSVVTYKGKVAIELMIKLNKEYDEENNNNTTYGGNLNGL